jgi:hypothetical protein
MRGRADLSESIDLDGGKPIVIHHDLAWSPVRWTHRMGRVARASTGFKGPSRKDIHHHEQGWIGHGVRDSIRNAWVQGAFGSGRVRYRLH